MCVSVCVCVCVAVCTLHFVRKHRENPGHSFYKEKNIYKQEKLEIACNAIQVGIVHRVSGFRSPQHSSEYVGGQMSA